MQAAPRTPEFLETAGFNAFRLGLNSFDAPYKPGTSELKSWLKGYSEAKRKHASAMAVNDKNKPTPSTTVAPSGTPRREHRPTNKPRRPQGR